MFEFRFYSQQITEKIVWNCQFAPYFIMILIYEMEIGCNYRKSCSRLINLTGSTTIAFQTMIKWLENSIHLEHRMLINSNLKVNQTLNSVCGAIRNSYL